MSTIAITDPARLAAVVVVHERGAPGADALLHAHALAAAAHARLTVVAVASTERTDIGCGSCRQAAMFRNEIARECSIVALGEARDVLASVGPQIGVDFESVRGRFDRAVGQAARDHRAGVIVLPAIGPVRRRLGRDRVRLLERHTAASVVVAPARVRGL